MDENICDTESNSDSVFASRIDCTLHIVHVCFVWFSLKRGFSLGCKYSFGRCNFLLKRISTCTASVYYIYTSAYFAPLQGEKAKFQKAGPFWFCFPLQIFCSKSYLLQTRQED